jgi:hypothetical protein
MMGDWTLSRRGFLGAAVGGFYGFALRNNLASALSQAATVPGRRCLVLWMEGGPSQFETFDPKPGASTGGEAEAIATAAEGLRISSFLPEVAKRGNRLAVLRNVTSPEGDHERATYYLHTGFKRIEGFPRPALGSVVAHERTAAAQPRYVAMGSRGFGPAYLGLEHAPFAIDDPARAVELLDGLRRRSDRLRFTRELGAEFGRVTGSSEVAQRDGMLGRIEGLLGSPFAKALDPSNEPEAVRQRYGEDAFGRDCLIARRLLEAGVPFVEVRLSGWDTHANNHEEVGNLCARLDGPWATLLDDLSASGLLEETLVVWMGEFGRTPIINANAGRDHFPNVTPVVLAGAGVKGGQAVGRTNPIGDAVEGKAHSVADLFATILTGLRIDPATTFTTSFDSPTKATDNGTVIPGVLS